MLKSAFDNEKKIFIYFTVVSAILTFGNVIINNSVSILVNPLGLHNGIVNWNWFYMFNPFRGIYGYSFVYFCLGGLAHENINKIKEIPEKRRCIISIIIIFVATLCLFILGIVLSNVSGEIWDVVWGGYDTIFVLAIFVLCLSYSGKNNKIKLVSTNTLGIYFTHEIFIHLTRNYIQKITVANNLIGCFVYSLIILSVCLGISCLLKKLPYIKWLVKL